nr:histidine phosphatase family protein [uncultured Dethiosulfovibrio sp.]
MIKGKTTVILIRHGECDGNVKGMFRGQMDFPLNERGLRQAQEAGDAAKKLGIDAIYSSPLLRAKQTAQAVAEACGLSVANCPGVNNISLGSWEGRIKEEIAKEEPTLWNTWLNAPEDLAFPGMEPLTDVMARSRAALDDIVKAHQGGTVAVVSHRTTLKPLVASCLDIPKPWFWRLHFDTASLTTLLHDEKGYSLLHFNGTDHLSEYRSEWN